MDKRTARYTALHWYSIHVYRQCLHGIEYYIIYISSKGSSSNRSIVSISQQRKEIATRKYVLGMAVILRENVPFRE